MTTLRTTLAIALTVATLGFSAIAASPASAHGYRHGGFHRHFSHIGHRHFGWGHHRFAHRWGYRHRWSYGHRYGHRYGYGHRWGGYRHVVVGSAGGAPRACGPGTHLGYNGKYCWPNR